MEKIYIYGAGKRGHELLSLIDSRYNSQIFIGGFLDSCKTGYIEGYEISKPNQISTESTIVVSIADFDVALEVVLGLKTQGFLRVYWYNIKVERKTYCDFFLEQCVKCDDWSESTFAHVEMHAMDACNLNCVGCTHFSPIFDLEKPNTASRLADISALKEKVCSIANFYILGGEPLLNDEVDIYIRAVKKNYPLANVTLVTNGLLIPRCSDAFLSFLSNNNICVSISEYKPTHGIIDKIINILHEFNIRYVIRLYETKQKFNIPLSSERMPEKYCISDGCVNIWNGMIARCPTLMYIPILNKRFGLHYPEEGIYSMDEIGSDIEIKNLLKEDVPLCCYCAQNEVEWSVCGKKVKETDFISIK